MKKQLSLWARSTDRRWKRVVIILAVLVAIPAIPLCVAEYNDQRQARNLLNALSQFGQGALSPVGGVSLRSGTVCSHVTDFLYSLESGPCPRAAETWRVPVEQGKEAAFLTGILSEEGYTVHVGSQSSYKPGFPLEAGGIKNGVGLDMELILNQSDQPSQPAPDGKQWLQLGITATESR